MSTESLGGSFSRNKGLRSESPCDFRSIQNNAPRGRLVTVAGEEMEGYSFGANKSMCGEMVFNTGMVGYPEALTDPSYAGQILVFTFPLIGNYGVPGEERDEHGLLKNFESDKIQVAGILVGEYSLEYSHWNAVKSLGQWLSESGIPALYGMDTRMLTIKIREVGSILGKIEFRGQSVDFSDPNLSNLVDSVSSKEVSNFQQIVLSTSILPVNHLLSVSLFRHHRSVNSGSIIVPIFLLLIVA